MRSARRAEGRGTGATRLAPVRSDWCRFGGGLRMHARVSAGPVPPNRPPVVLVHGQVVSSRYLVPLIERLGCDFPVFAPDLPGFGRSDKPRNVLTVRELADALAAWMTAAGLERAVLLGNSPGCQIAVDLAARHRRRALALVLQGPTADPRARAARQQLGRILMNSWREESPGIGPLLDYAQAGMRRAVGTFRYLLRDEIERKLPHVRVPTLIVRGAKDLGFRSEAQRPASLGVPWDDATISSTSMSAASCGGCARPAAPSAGSAARSAGRPRPSAASGGATARHRGRPTGRAPPTGWLLRASASGPRWSA